MNAQLLEYYKEEIKDLMDKNLIRKSQSPWSCAAFYVQKPSEIEKGVPRLVINYKPLNKVLKWIRYPIPNKRDLIGRLHNASIFSNFDMKSGFGKYSFMKKIDIKLHSLFHLGIMNAMLCLLV